jgi:hypothetical protein
MELSGFHGEIGPLVSDLPSDASQQAPQNLQLLREGVCRWRRSARQHRISINVEPGTALEKKSLCSVQVISGARDNVPTAPDPGRRIVEHVPDVFIERRRR